MRQIWIPRNGDPSVLEIREAPDVAPGPGEVAIAVKASGVNFADLMARIGVYADAPPLPCVVGYEVSGDVEALGEGVDASWRGAPVVAMTRFGGYSTRVVVPVDQVTRRPEGMDAITGAAIPVVYLTAWMICEIMGRVREGDRVLVHSAGGGVGLAALDLLKWRGAFAIGTASPGKHDALRARGYDQLIDYRSQDYADVLRDQDGLDLILDPLGADSWTKGLSLLRAGGRIAMFGMSANAKGNTRSVLTVARNIAAVPWLKTNPVALINANKGVLGVNMGHLWHESARVAGWTASVMDLWTQGVVRPLVHAAVPFDEVAEAHRILHDRENLGKVVLTV